MEKDITDLIKRDAVAVFDHSLGPLCWWYRSMSFPTSVYWLGGGRESPASTGAPNSRNNISQSIEESRISIITNYDDLLHKGWQANATRGSVRRWVDGPPCQPLLVHACIMLLWENWPWRLFQETLKIVVWKCALSKDSFHLTISNHLTLHE